MTTSNSKILIISLSMERKNSINKIDVLNEQKFIALNKDINNGFKNVQAKYDELSKVASPVVENEYLWGLIKSTNIEKSLVGLLETIKGLANCTLGAFQANSKNLEAILDLMKISVSIENDLYKQLKDSDCSKENIANLLHDFCSQYNIDNQAIEGLFEQSFNRTITLRTRINDLREEIIKHISRHEDRFNYLDDVIQKKGVEFTQYFDCKTAEYEKENRELRIQIETQSRNISKLQNHLTWSLGISIIATIVAAIGFII